MRLAATSSISDKRDFGDHQALAQSAWRPACR